MGCLLSSYFRKNEYDNAKYDDANVHGTNELSLEFLIILKEHDFKGNMWWSLLNRIQSTTYKLPGLVHICCYHNVKQYKIKGLILPYVLYMKLPKENVFVPSDSWEAEYFNSQTLELLKIFTLLGASDIKFKTSRDHNDSMSTGVHAGANLNAINIPLKLGTTIEHYDDVEDANAFDGQISTKQPVAEKYETLEELIIKNNLYYLKNNYEWQSLISYKLQNDSISKLKFTTTFHKGFKCGKTIATELEALGITVSLFDAGSKHVKTTFEVYFCDENGRDEKSRDGSSGGSLSMHI